MDKDQPPLQPCANPQCRFKFDIFSNDRGYKYTTAIVGTEMAVFCGQCGAVNIQSIQIGRNGKPEWVTLGAMTFQNFANQCIASGAPERIELADRLASEVKILMSRIEK